MAIFKVIGIGIISLCIVMILKKERPEIGVLCVIASSVIILTLVIENLNGIIIMLQNLIDKTGINSQYIKVILKVIGISYMVEFGKSICNDAGESAIANKIEIAGKILVVSVSIPVILSLVNIISEVI